MALLDELRAIRAARAEPCLVGPEGSWSIDDLLARRPVLEGVAAGDVVALEARLDAASVATLLALLDRGAVVVPLAPVARDASGRRAAQLSAAGVELLARESGVERVGAERSRHPLLEELRRAGHPGLVLFTSGTTGEPRAILHDFTRFLLRYRAARPALRTLGFLQLDHVGGVNTLFHTLLHGGTVVAPPARTAEAIVETIARMQVELLPTTPTFLRMLLLGGWLRERALASLRLVTYGAEPMDPATLEACCRALPNADFRQTYGLSELGILRVRSRARDSLWIRIGGDGVETRVVDGSLWIRSASRMLGYLNAPSPFVDGWHDTGDLVDVDGEHVRIRGRRSRAINVGGAKIEPEEIERAALRHPDVLRCTAAAAPNPITGQHVEVRCELRPGAELGVAALREHFARELPRELRPHRVRIEAITVGPRFKRG